MDFSVWAAALFTFLGVFTTSLFNYFLKRKKQEQDYNQTFIQNIFTQIGKLQNRVDVLEDEREELINELNKIKQENAELRAENKLLYQKLEQLEKK